MGFAVLYYDGIVSTWFQPFKLYWEGVFCNGFINPVLCRCFYYHDSMRVFGKAIRNIHIHIQKFFCIILITLHKIEHTCMYGEQMLKNKLMA